MELQGKFALVTGAGSGIGAASALLLARAGARIGALGRTEDELQKMVSRIRDCGGEATPLLADVASSEEMSRAVGPPRRSLRPARHRCGERWHQRRVGADRRART